jgi:genetic interactor of prohibitins 3, mitochondrial
MILRPLQEFSFFRGTMSGGIRLGVKVVRQIRIPVADLPVFLCPGILRFSSLSTILSTIPRREEHRPRRFQVSQQRNIISVTSGPSTASPKVLAPLLDKLPQQCPGCGALSQTADQDAPGFYTPTRKSIRAYLEGVSSPRKSAENEVIRAALENAASVETGISVRDFSVPGKKAPC